MGCGASSARGDASSAGGDASPISASPISEYAPTLPHNSIPALPVPAHAHLVGRSAEGGGQSLHGAVGCCTAVGHRPKSSAQGELLNQDRGIVAWPLGGKGDEARLLLGVFDGHGPRGEAVSDFVALSLLASLEGQLAGRTSGGGYQVSPDNGKLSWVAAGGCSEAPLLESALEDVEARLCVEHKHLAHHNGTTALLALLRPGAVSVASVGDSRCVAAVADQTSGAWVARDLSTDHTPAAPAERARILELGGALTSDGDAYVTSDGYGGGGDGAVRVLSKSSLSSLALSRSVRGPRPTFSLHVLVIPPSPPLPPPPPPVAPPPPRPPPRWGAARRRSAPRRVRFLGGRTPPRGGGGALFLFSKDAIYPVVAGCALNIHWWL